MPTPGGSRAIGSTLVEVVSRLRRGVDDVGGLGVGAPGLVDRSGVLRYAPNLPGVVDLDVGEVVSRGTGLEVAVDNDANCALWGEHLLGAARGTGEVLLATLGTGIGGGLLLGGRLERGAGGFAGEIGHMVVVRDGIECRCGRRGCWERYASGSALSARGQENATTASGGRLLALAGGDVEAVRGEHVTAAAIEGDPASLAIIEDFAGWVALGLANLVAILDVERCVIGGGLVDAGDALLSPLRAALPPVVLAAQHRHPVPLAPAQLGERAGAIGAALLARHLPGASGGLEPPGPAVIQG